MYKQFIKPFLSCFKPEISLRIFLGMLGVSRFFPGGGIVRLFHNFDDPSLERELFGLKFKNPVGLAAGMDNNAKYLGEFSNLGFSFIEIGSVTPLPQESQAKSRLYRLPKDKAFINCSVVRNKGVKCAISNIQENSLKIRRRSTVICANIAPNSSSHKDEEVIRDYQAAFSLMYDFVDMFTVNVSSPNDDGILAIQDRTALADVIDPLLDLRLTYDSYRPILIKISPDIPFDQLDEILDYCMMSGVDGIVATNYTKCREELTTKSRKLEAIGPGFLSGAPLYKRSLKVVRHIDEFTNGRLPIIGCGGIMNPEQASEMLSAGASLIELHSGVIYEGPRLVKKILKHLVSDK